MDPALASLIDLQRTLETRTAAIGSVRDLLEVGGAVLDFAAREEPILFPLLPFLDPAAQADLGDEHTELASDLQLLEWLVSTTPESTDVATLADALARRMRDHIARDGRLLAQASRLGRAGARDPALP